MLVPCCGSATLWVVLFFGSKPPGCVAMALWLFGWNKTGTWSINGRKGQASASHHPELDSKSLVSYIQKKKRPATYILIYVIPYISISNRISVHFPSIFIESFLRAKWPDPPPTVAPKPGQAASVVKYGNFIAFNQPICGIFIGIS